MFVTVFDFLGLHLSKEEMQKVHAEMDINGDGFVTLEDVIIGMAPQVRKVRFTFIVQTHKYARSHTSSFIVLYYFRTRLNRGL
jgi:hypothetical protein